MKTIASILIVVLAFSSAMARRGGPFRGGHQGGRLTSDCYRCDYDDCISYSHICDGTTDCLDGSDEVGCHSICPFPEYYRCGDTGLCMDSYHVCDGRPDCRNGEDEAAYNCLLYTSKGTEQSDLKKKVSRSLESNKKEKSQ